jgi:uncharacterized protein (TIGR00375 family)
MRWYADLHIHSKYSLATSPRMDLETIALWAEKKGLSIVATGDALHPKWLSHISRTVQETEGGLFCLPEYSVQFILQAEVSTIYKKGGKTRKIHHLIFFPHLQSVKRLSKKLKSFGKLHSDGRPILSLCSEDLLEAVIEVGAFLVPAHIWTPWYGVLGAKSGFDSIEECYGKQACQIHAVETGLSSDPPMNRRISSLDRYQLISASDAHCPEKMGRNATIFSCERSFSAIKAALEKGLVSTLELFPEAGKYFFDGHRKCGLSLSPKEAERVKNLCPRCHKPLTLGVLHRVEELADRARPNATYCCYQIPLLDLLSQLLGYTTHSKRVFLLYEELIEKIGSELYLLHDISIEKMKKYPQLAKALTKIRKRHVDKEPGFDGKYGKILTLS